MEARMSRRILVTLDVNPKSVQAARIQWQGALAAAVRAESIYNAAIEKGLPQTDDEAAGVRKCPCPVNAAGDIRCHKCGEYVNKRCWNCKTPRGAGECPTVPARA